ncbi:MmgE/PrpD family protein [Mycobacterium sp.]|uniref:MmgE/PrpD family protein n=1 Tax=Mycobacterium sp. TaxID=1785 RepID=UPI002B7BC7BC|nr:MmgE/PrpD family protein [Mycobacterium sp.]HTH87287.1 MmgE/PrpD family protein [Mycobacterium sp.]
MSDRIPVSRALAAFASEVRAENLPDDVVHQAVRCLVDWLGCAVAGAATPESARVRAAIRAMDPDGSRAAAIIGTPERTSAGQAALANGIAAHVLDFDDTFNPDRTTIHGSAPLWPAIAAACELVPVSGKLAIAAFVAGFEVQTRVAVAAGPGHYDIGWHVTGTVGHIGAAVTTARLLGLSPELTLAALGTGATQSAGMKVVYGSMGKSLHAGKAAMDGLLSGFLARDGFTSATEPVEGHRGFLHLFSPDPILERAVEGLGDTWYLPRDGFKPYACGSLTHPPAQALLELRAEHALTDSDVAAVDAYVHDYVKTTTGLAEPHTGLEGKFSIYHVLAVALADGAAFLDQFTDDRVSDPELARLRRQVRVHVDPVQTKDSARVVLTLRDGRTLERHIAHNLGTPDNPMTDRQLEDKFVALAAPVLGRPSTDELAQVCWKLLELDDIRAVTDLAVPPI